MSTVYSLICLGVLVKKLNVKLGYLVCVWGNRLRSEWRTDRLMRLWSYLEMNWDVEGDRRLADCLWLSGGLSLAFGDRFKQSASVSAWWQISKSQPPLADRKDFRGRSWPCKAQKHKAMSDILVMLAQSDSHWCQVWGHIRWPDGINTLLH